jgi:drug/metabolite transporter (DMT)-like permease
MPSSSRESVPLAVALGGLSSLSFAAMSAALKAAKIEGATLGQQVFFRCLVTAVCMAAVVAVMRISLRGLPLKVLLLRTLFGGTAMALSFWALSRPEISLGDSEILRRTSPVFVVLLGWPVLREKPTRLSIALLALAFAGTALVVGPGFRIQGLAATVALIGGSLGAGAYLAIRLLVRKTPATLVILFFTAAVSIASAPFALSSPMPTGNLLLALLAAGVAGTLGQIFMTHAYRFAPAGIVSTTGYLAVAFSTYFSIVFFDRAPTAMSIAGAILITLSCVLISLTRPQPTGSRGGLDAIPPRG